MLFSKGPLNAIEVLMPSDAFVVVFFLSKLRFLRLQALSQLEAAQALKRVETGIQPGILKGGESLTL